MAEFSEYRSNKRQLIAELRQAQLEGLKKTGKRVVKSAKRKVRKKSHDLEKSIEMKGQPKRGPNGYTLEIRSDLLASRNRVLRMGGNTATRPTWDRPWMRKRPA